MIYKFKPGSMVAGNPQKIGERLTELTKLHRGKLMPEVVVEDARSPRSPLHRCFEWNDGVAADKYRLNQARHVIAVVVTVMPEKRGPGTATRAFVSLSRGGGKAGRHPYIPIRTALGNVVTRQALVAKALAELESWHDRYSELKELADIFAAIERHTDRMARKAA